MLQRRWSLLNVCGKYAFSASLILVSAALAQDRDIFWGDVVNNLRVGLYFDKYSFGTNERVVAHVVFWNTPSQPIYCSRLGVRFMVTDGQRQIRSDGAFGPLHRYLPPVALPADSAVDHEFLVNHTIVKSRVPMTAGPWIDFSTPGDYIITARHFFDRDSYVQSGDVLIKVVPTAAPPSNAVETADVVISNQMRLATSAVFQAFLQSSRSNAAVARAKTLSNFAALSRARPSNTSIAEVKVGHSSGSGTRPREGSTELLEVPRTMGSGEPASSSGSTPAVVSAIVIPAGLIILFVLLRAHRRTFVK